MKLPVIVAKLPADIIKFSTELEAGNVKDVNVEFIVKVPFALNDVRAE